MEHVDDELVGILFDSSFMTLATADTAGRPWASPVEFACDEEMRFYWTSHLDARHSRNVRANPRAALSIFDSRQVAGADAPAQGLYAEGVVEEFHRDELDAVLPSLRRWLEWRRAARTRPLARSTAVANEPESPWRQYRLTPTNVYALDPAGHPDIPGIRVWRMSVDLAAPFARAYRSRLEG